MCSGTVLDPGEDIQTPRVVDTVGVGYATALHGLYQMAPEVVQTLPGGSEWIARLENEFGPDDRHWADEGHLVTITDRDRPAVEQAGEGLPQCCAEPTSAAAPAPWSRPAVCGRSTSGGVEDVGADRFGGALVRDDEGDVDPGGDEICYLGMGSAHAGQVRLVRGR